MTPERLAEIKRAVELASCACIPAVTELCDDTTELIAEVERLQRENRRLANVANDVQHARQVVRNARDSAGLAGGF
jgi:hypothetical protein